MKKYACLLLTMVLLLLPVGASAEITSQDQAFMRECFSLARFAIQRGDDPFGAVLVKNGKIIMRADNTVHTDNDKLDHAETNLIAAALRELGSDAIKGSTLYSSCEPCSMCCGAIQLGEGLIVRLVYGLPAYRLVEMVGQGKALSSQGFFEWAGNSIKVEGPVLESEAEEAIREYLAFHHKR